MRFHDLSIQSKLFIILIFMVVTPIVIFGLLLYIKFRSDIVENTKKELTSIVQNWQTITNSYIQQEDRVLKREQVLVEQRLQTTILTAKKLLEVPESSRANIYNEISKISFGRSGYVFVLDKNGTYIVSKGRLRDGENLLDMKDGKGEYFIQGIISKVRSLDQDDTYTTSYEWKEVSDNKLRKMLVTFIYSKKYDLILGAGTYYSDFQSTDLKTVLQDELRERMSAQVVKNRGYVGAINSEGEYLVSKDNLRNGENILDFQDENGNYVVKGIIEEATKLKPGETYTTAYKWKNIGEEKFYNRITTFVYVPEWDWIIGATAYEEDYLSTIDTIGFYIFLIGILAVIAGSAVSYRFSDVITKPIKELERVADKATQGNLSIRVSPDLLAEGAEIGSLAKSFNNMMITVDKNITRLDTFNKKIAQSAQVLESKNDELGRMNKLMVDRELKMVELKKEIEELKAQHE